LSGPWARHRGRSFCFIVFFRCALILSDPLFRVKPARFQPVDSISLVLKKFGPPRFQGNPSNLLHHPVHVESGRLGTQVSQKSGDDQGGFRGPGAAAVSLGPAGLYGPPATSSNRPAPPRRFIRACLAGYLVQGCLDILATQFWPVGSGWLHRPHRRRQEHVARGSHIASADNSFAQVTELTNDHMLRSGARRLCRHSMICRAAAPGLSRRNEHVFAHTVAAEERSRQGHCCHWRSKRSGP
jgi:hypothetical protein